MITGINTRRSCVEFLEKVADERVWFGMEQEYFIMGHEGLPLNWDKDPKAVNLSKLYTMIILLDMYKYLFFIKKIDIHILWLRSQQVIYLQRVNVGPCIILGYTKGKY